jgi:hypothetical protein
MDVNTLAIPIAFLLVSVVVCLALIRADWKWTLKLALILVVPAFGVAVWNALGSYRGWPATERPPAKSIVYSVIIVEPDSNDKGNIYLWLIPYEEKAHLVLNPLVYLPDGNEPRGYRIPYSRPLHVKLEQAKELIRAGRAPILELRGGKKKAKTAGQGNAPPGDAPSGEHPERPEGLGGSDGAETDEYKVYELPPPHPNQKYE